MKCKKHPGYRGVRKQRVDCFKCKLVYLFAAGERAAYNAEQKARRAHARKVKKVSGLKMQYTPTSPLPTQVSGGTVSEVDPAYEAFQASK